MLKRSFLGTILPVLAFYAAPEEGGGTPQKTLKEQLADANARIAELEPKSQLAIDLQGKLTEAEGKVKTLEGEKTELTNKVTEAEGKVKTLEGEKTELTNKVTEAEGKVKTLEGDVKTSQENFRKLKERAAAHGITGISIESPKAGEESVNGEQLYAEYNKLTGRAKTAFFAKNEKALLAYAESLKGNE
jgi:chromosome segregation ATPase